VRIAPVEDILEEVGHEIYDLPGDASVECGKYSDGTRSRDLAPLHGDLSGDRAGNRGPVTSRAPVCLLPRRDHDRDVVVD
jgi:hypothetical protein